VWAVFTIVVTVSLRSAVEVTITVPAIVQHITTNFITLIFNGTKFSTCTCRLALHIFRCSDNNVDSAVFLISQPRKVQGTREFAIWHWRPWHFCKLNHFLIALLIAFKRTALFWVITQRVVVIYDRRFGTNNRSHRQGTRILGHLIGPIFRGQEFLTPEDGTDRLSLNSVRNYHYSLRNNPEERNSQFYALFRQCSR